MDFFYRCLCQDGWFGPMCSSKFNPCDSNRHNCSEGSTCVPLIAEYVCDCPSGKSGKFCEKGKYWCWSDKRKLISALFFFQRKY